MGNWGYNPYKITGRGAHLVGFFSVVFGGYVGEVRDEQRQGFFEIWFLSS